MSSNHIDFIILSSNDDENDDFEQYVPPARIAASRTTHSDSSQPRPTIAAASHQLGSSAQLAINSSVSCPAIASIPNSVRPSHTLSLTQFDSCNGALSSVDSSSLSERCAEVVRRRAPTSHNPSTASASASFSASASTSPYSWLFDQSPHLFSSTTVLASGTRPFEWLNTVDDTSPVTYLHSVRNVLHPSGKNEAPHIENNPDCCQCSEASQCIDGSCDCTRFVTHDAMHTRDGLRAMRTGGEPPPNAWITECNDDCSCARWQSEQRCLNRVVQSAPVNPNLRLLVFHTGYRGWGALTLQRIPAWQYVCEYVGEVISDSLAEIRSDKYLFSVDSKLITGGTWDMTEEPPIIDATQVGHIARFINHSCDPNCNAYHVLAETHRGPYNFRIAFFTNRDIEAGEELSIDYKYGEKDQLRLFGGPCRCYHCGKGTG